jgi:hypothetical protein
MLRLVLSCSRCDAEFASSVINVSKLRDDAFDHGWRQYPVDRCPTCVKLDARETAEPAVPVMGETT